MSESAWKVPTHLIPKPEDVAKILAATKTYDLRYYVFFMVSANTGLRVSEVIHLKKKDVIGDKLIITRRKKRVLKEETIDITPALSEVLSEWIKKIPDGWLFRGNSSPCIIARSNGKVLQLCGGKHLHIRTVQTRWRFLISQLGLYMPHRGIHSLRHFFGTEFQRQFKDLISTQAALGHSSPTITAGYAHAVEMAEKMQTMRPIK